VRSAQRLDRIPPYLFAELNRRRDEAVARGVDVIDLGVGDPDRPTPAPIVAQLCAQANRPELHRYPAYEGDPVFRQAAAEYMARRFGVTLDPDREVIAVIGSKEGLAHMVWAVCDPGDVVLCAEPAYPVPRNHTLLCGGEPVAVPLRAERGWLPDLEAIPAEAARRAKALFLNYPNNPTAGVADLDFFERAVAFCRRHDILLVHDAAYAEVCFDGYRAPSVLQVPGAREVAIEFHSLSKTFNMTGWRLGWACGAAAAVRALGAIKTNTDSGQWGAVQAAGAFALTALPAALIAETQAVYAKRRDVMVAALRAAGVEAPTPRATFYLWCPVPPGYDAAGFASELLERAGVVVAPGEGYGASGAGYFRISLTVPDERLREAAERIRALGGPRRG
jgi:LL-diaminopimelate aminotransferase